MEAEGEEEEDVKSRFYKEVSERVLRPPESLVRH
jgi:hypothetical protein